MALTAAFEKEFATVHVGKERLLSNTVSVLLAKVVGVSMCPIPHLSVIQTRKIMDVAFLVLLDT